MKITKLQLENFRNYKSHAHNFDKELTILVGPNAIGKTNFLEAVYMLSLGKSFRCDEHGDMVNWSHHHLRCTGEIQLEDERLKLEVFYSHQPLKKKNFKRNGVNLKNRDYLGNLITVLFQPEDLNMLYLSPALRRRYLDILLSQIDRSYLSDLLDCQHVLRQRNALLRSLREKEHPALFEDLEVWNDELIKFAIPLTEKRLQAVNFFNQNLPRHYSEIAGESSKIVIEYHSRILNQEKSSNSQKHSLQEPESSSPQSSEQSYSKTLQMSFKKALTERQKLDIIRSHTSIGPHRDDLIFYLNDKEISKTASRGEYRTLLLALKLTEIEFIKEKTGKLPVLLLDDVFSELDRKRQTHLLKSIKGCQTIITTTDIENIEKEALKKASLVYS